MLQICAAGPSLVQLLRPLFASFALPLFLSVHRVGQSVVLIAVIHGHGHGRFLSNLGHLLGFCVQIVPSAQQGQHQQHHDGGQHTDDGIQFLGFLFHLRRSLRVAGVVVSGAVHALAGHHGVAVVRHRVHRADGRPVVGIRISARAGRQRGAVRDRRRRGHRAAPAPELLSVSESPESFESVSLSSPDAFESVSESPLSSSESVSSESPLVLSSSESVSSLSSSSESSESPVTDIESESSSSESSSSESPVTDRLSESVSVESPLSVVAELSVSVC